MKKPEKPGGKPGAVVGKKLTVMVGVPTEATPKGEFRAELLRFFRAGGHTLTVVNVEGDAHARGIVEAFLAKDGRDIPRTAADAAEEAEE